MAELVTIGWREWVALPELSDIPIKVKVDSGAKTCALHAFKVEPFEKDGTLYVKYLVHPFQHDDTQFIECNSLVVDQREVSDSGGHREMRYVVETVIELGEAKFSAEITLTDRDSMKFRMLLGRNVLKNKYLVDCSQSFMLGGKYDSPDKSSE